MRDTALLSDWGSVEIIQARHWVEQNGDVLNAVRRTLARKCSVPLRCDASFFEPHCEDVAHLRNIARAFALDLRVAEDVGDWASATRIGVDTLELANALQRGGLISDLLVSIALSGVALEQLRKLRTRLDGARRSALISDLERLERERDVVWDIMERDRQWELAAGLSDAICDSRSLELSDGIERGLTQDDRQIVSDVIRSYQGYCDSEQTRSVTCVDQDNSIVALMRMLAIDLAIRSYHAIHYAYPTDICVLAPYFSVRLPLDPFTEEPFLYRRLAEGSFVVYSTGPTRVDHGGIFGPWSMVAAGEVDLCLDVNDY